MDVNAEQITKLRIAVARFGEMDRFKWWNTKGMLGHLGELAISRGFPKTHVFARCRATFTVASSRSDEVFNPLDSFTLWRLPVEIEDRIEDAWANWLETPEPWKAFLAEADAAANGSLLERLQSLNLISERTVASVSKFRRADDLRSVPIKTSDETITQAIELLAAAFNSSEPGKLAVPHIRSGEFPQ